MFFNLKYSFFNLKTDHFSLDKYYFLISFTPSCKTYASRKAYDNKIEDDIAELTYKREYQRRITQVYRADKKQKEQMKKDFKIWKDKAREQLKLYRENKISKERFCNWIEKNK